jgi:hypothetical protein
MARQIKTRLGTAGVGLILALVSIFVLALPGTSSGQLPGATVTVCQVTGSANAPNFAEVQVSADQVAAYLNQYPGSFVGGCPSGGGGAGDSPPLNGAVTVCRVSGRASAPILSEVLISADQVAAYLNQNPGSFVGVCPASDDGGNAGGPSGGTGPLNAVVTVCRVTGNVNAPHIVQLTLTVDQVVAFLNKNPDSFIGTCPGKGGTTTKPPGRILGIPLGAALTICQVTTSARAVRFVQVNVVVDRMDAFLNQHPGSFVGLCPSSDDANGTIGNEPLGYATICRVTGDAENPLAPATVRRDNLGAYLTRAGTVTVVPTSGCQASTAPDGGENPPSSTQPGKPETIVVDTTPNTVVTATGAGVNESTTSNKTGKAKLKVTAKKKGIITVRADRGRVVQRIGVASPSRSGANLTG